MLLNLFDSQHMTAMYACSKFQKGSRRFFSQTELIVNTYCGDLVAPGRDLEHFCQIYSYLYHRTLFEAYLFKEIFSDFRRPPRILQWPDI
jgi:hypothetical protein